jgi:hypothetical protein
MLVCWSELDVLVILTEMLDESLEEALEVTGIVESEDVAVAIQLHALLTRLATLRVQAAMANDGIALFAVTGPDVKIPQKDTAASSLQAAGCAQSSKAVV